jgi:hypothetical protein
VVATEDEELVEIQINASTVRSALIPKLRGNPFQKSPTVGVKALIIQDRKNARGIQIIMNTMIATPISAESTIHLTSHDFSYKSIVDGVNP